MYTREGGREVSVMSSTDTHIYTHSHTNTLTNDLYQRHLPPSSHAALYTPFLDGFKARVYSSYYIWHYKNVVLNDNLCLSGVTCFPKTTVEGAVSCSRRWTHLPSTLSRSVQYNTPVNHDTCCSVHTVQVFNRVKTLSHNCICVHNILQLY